MGDPSDDPSLTTTPEGLRHPDRLPEKVRAAAVALMLGPLAPNPMRLGKALVGSWPVCVRRVAGTTALVVGSGGMSTACSQVGSSTGGVSSGSPTGAASCAPPGGGRCAGPEPVGRWLVDQLGVDATGTVISGRFQCGGALEASETSSRVLLAYIASAVGFGGMAWMLVPLSVQLTSPLGDRAVIDGVTGEHLDVATSTASGARVTSASTGASCARNKT